MRNVRIVLAVAIALLIAIELAAQEKKPQGKASKLSTTSQVLLRIERLRETLDGLDLTAEQKEKLAKIREDLGPKMKEFFEKLSDVVSEEQREAAKEAMDKAREAGKKGRQALEAVEASLKLTDEQKAKMAKLDPEIQAIAKEMMTEVMGILTPEQRAKLKEKMAPAPKKAGKKAEKKEAQ